MATWKPKTVDMNPTSTVVRRAIEITRLLEPYDLRIAEIETICCIQNYADIAYWVTRNLPLTSSTAEKISRAIAELDRTRA